MKYVPWSKRIIDDGKINWIEVLGALLLQGIKIIVCGTVSYIPIWIFGIIIYLLGFQDYDVQKDYGLYNELWWVHMFLMTIGWDYLTRRGGITGNSGFFDKEVDF